MSKIPACLNDKSFTSIQIGEHPLAKSLFQLNPQHIDIWLYPLESLWPHAESLINNEELQRANRYHFERHRRRFIIARALLRLILARYLDLRAQDIDFVNQQHGKPTIEHPSRIEFNLSHSKDSAILAVGQHYPLGIDIEYFSSRPFQGMSNMMFSNQEITDYAKIPKNMRSLAFFQVWAQKEAFIKAGGMGLSYPTQTFDVPVGRFENTLIWDAKHAVSWYMRPFMPKIACCAALCHHPNVTSIRYHDIKDIHAFR